MHKRLITYLLLLVATVCYGVEQSNVQGYGSLVNMPTEQLMEKGRIHFSDHNPDSALVCFSIVANRYNKSQRSQGRENAALALNDLACIYQYFYFDYQEAHHNYMKALELCDEGGYEKAKAITSLNLANLLSLYSKGFESKPVSNQARELYHQSLEGAYKTSNWELYATAFIDYADNYTDIKLKDYSHLFSRNIPDTIQNLKYARYYYRALENIQKGSKGYNALLYSAFRGNLEIFKKLMELGANINETNSSGLNALHLAVQGNHPNIIVYLMEKCRFDINSKDINGSNALHWGINMNSRQAVDYLVYYNIDIDAKDKDGETALGIA